MSIEGNHRIKKSTVIELLKIKVGDNFEKSMTANVIRKLYESNFFDDIKIFKRNSTLVIKVKERPTISSIVFSGNKDIPKAQLDKILKQVGLVRGRMLDRSALDKITQSIRAQYVSRGKQNVNIITNIEKVNENSVKVKVDIDEGGATIIREIRIIGNNKFSTRRLIKEMYISTPGFLTFFTEEDKYSKEKLDASLEALKNFYLDRGYINIKILSHQVTKSPNSDQVYITIKISEGNVYRIKDYYFAGNIVLTKKELDKNIYFKNGDIFSRKEVVKTISGINDLLADRGYTFSIVDIKPEIDEENQEVSIIFFINPGRPVYVRNIIFTGNHKTADYVLRRAFKQEEGSLLSMSRINESLRQIRILSYIKDVKYNQKQVPGSNNQVDYYVNVEEGRIAEMSASAGIGTYGFEFNAGYNNHNVFGTGCSGGINFKNDNWGNYTTVSYFNPFYTKSGIGRGFSFYYYNHKPGKGNFSNFLQQNTQISSYVIDKFGGAMDFSIPLSDTHSFDVGFGLERLSIKNLRPGGNQETIAKELRNFVASYGKVFHQGKITAGWSRSSYDQFPFPKRGSHQKFETLLSFPVSHENMRYLQSSSKMKFYKIGYTGHIYLPLFKGFILSVLGGAKYGKGLGSMEVLPFFENYHAGGMASPARVRGYRTISLGPRDSNDDALGGNFLVHNTVGLILPEPLSSDFLRIMIFFDAGNVYQTYKNKDYMGVQEDKDIRTSVGASIELHSPMGPIHFSLGFALNPKKEDKQELIGFAIEHSF
jgi:outer membrane protein insertion porin family